MMKRIKWLAGFLLLASFWIAFSTHETMANAKSVYYQTLTYGTTKTSMASGYFVHHASVTVKNHKYYVTMRIKTAKKLSSFPVKVLSVNGGAPQHVRKVKDGSGNSNYYYSFTTKNLKKKINAKLYINVPKVYKAKHLITFKFNTAGLPRLKAKASVPAASTKAVNSQKKTTSAANSSSLKAIGNGTKAKAARSSTQASSSSTSSSSQQSSSSTSISSSSSTPDSTRQTATTNKADKSKQSSRLPFLIAGIVVIAVIVIGGSLAVTRRKQ